MSSVALPLLKNTVSDSCCNSKQGQRILGGRRHREKNGVLWHMFRLSAQGVAHESRFLQNEYQVGTYVYQAPGTSYLVPYVVRAPARSTAVKNNLNIVQETANSSTWNHIFNFQQLLSLCHTRGSVPRSPYLPCQIMFQRKSSELLFRAELRNVLNEKLRGRGGSSCRFECNTGLIVSTCSNLYYYIQHY